MKRVASLLAVMGLSCMAAAVPDSLVNIQRTLSKAASGTAENPAVIRVMFYGQSITYGGWTNQVAEMLRGRFPNARFQIVNAAMGSFEANWLIESAEHDLYYYNPDLLILHTYGSTDIFRELVRRVRQRTTADLIIWTSHRSFGKDKNGEWKINPMTERLRALREIAKEFKACLVDVREHWDAYCKASGSDGRELMNDVVHPNAKGNDLFAKIFSDALVYKPELPVTDVSGSIERIGLDSPNVTRGADGSVTVTFEGNYLTCETLPGATPVPVRVLLDGKPAETCPELFHVTRPAGFITERPALLNARKVGLLQEEDWTISFLADSEPKGKRVHFRLTGSRSGEQGDGWSDQDFTSKNGALFFSKDKWINTFMFIYWPKQLEPLYPTKCSITFQSFPVYPATIPAQNQLRMVRYARFFGERNDAFMPTVLVQGISNGRHTVKLIPVNGGTLPIKAFHAHCPSAQW